MALKKRLPAIQSTWLDALPKFRSHLDQFFGSDVWFLKELYIFWVDRKCYSLHEGVLLVPHREQNRIILQHVDSVFRFARQLLHIKQTGGYRIPARERALRQFVEAVWRLEQDLRVLFYGERFRRFARADDFLKTERAELLGGLAQIYANMCKIPSFGPARSHLREATGAVLLRDTKTATLKLYLLLLYLRRTWTYVQDVLDALEDREEAAA